MNAWQDKEEFKSEFTKKAHLVGKDLPDLTQASVEGCDYGIAGLVESGTITTQDVCFYKFL